MIFADNMTIEQKLGVLADAAKYDVACTSSGVDRGREKGGIGSAAAAGICHSFAADGRCISLLKVLFTNECIFDCKYCINRSSNDVPRATFTPEELCRLTIEFYRRNYIEGLFLSSGVVRSPDYTMELIITSLRMLREEYHFSGYIHCKSIPGASLELTELAGWYADRMSVNLELPTAEGLRELAPNKSRKNILMPMRFLQEGIEESQEVLGMKGDNKGAYWHTRRSLEGKSIQEKKQEDTRLFGSNKGPGLELLKPPDALESSNILDPAVQLADHGIADKYQGLQKRAGSFSLQRTGSQLTKRGFVPAGQSSQMIIGATPESDFQIISVAEALYQKFDLKRVFYSAFVRVNDDKALPVLPGGPPLLREHRLYQADWLLRYYGFQSKELLTEQHPNFNVFLDPKCDWAIANLGQFPVEINQADYFTLLRVPGIGMKSAGRIIGARKHAVLKFDDLKKMGVVLKRALYFITCNGKMMYPVRMDEDSIVRNLLDAGEKLPEQVRDGGITYRQLSLFDNPSIFSDGKSREEAGFNSWIPAPAKVSVI